MKKGFTLIEVLVASMLMGMLVTILTMVFNSSSIAWRTGKAGIAELNDTRREIALYGRLADDALPRVDALNPDKVGLTVSAWSFKNGQKGRNALRSRAVVVSGGGGDSKTTEGEKSRVQELEGGRFSNLRSSSSQRRAWQTLQVDGPQKADSQKAYVVGVSSAGPDGKWDTDDDITTWPEEAR